MRVYHFLNSQYGLKDLRERRLKISRIMDLNDPFEFLSAELSDRGFRRALKQTKKTLAQKRGILCFSENWQNPVQWAHYADKHQGMCLGFDVYDKHLSKINYVDERITLEGAPDEEMMKKLLTTKFSHWSYEEEHRLFLSLEDEEEGLYYLPFSENVLLKRVIIGSHSKTTRKEVRDALGDLAPNIEVFKARAAFKTFEIVRNQNEKLWA